MSFISDYQSAVESELIARLSRIFTLRAMQYQGLTQSEIAHRLGISQPAISQQLRAAPSTSGLSSSLILTAASPALKELQLTGALADLRSSAQLPAGLLDSTPTLT